MIVTIKALSEAVTGTNNTSLGGTLADNENGWVGGSGTLSRNRGIPTVLRRHSDSTLAVMGGWVGGSSSTPIAMDDWVEGRGDSV